MIHVMHLIATLMIASEVDGLVRIITSEEVTREENFLWFVPLYQKSNLKKTNRID